MATKKTLAERILNEVYPVRSRDEKIDIREVYLFMDSIANTMAKEGLLEFWKLGATSSVDEAWITTYEDITITDATNSPSYLTMPAQPISLPQNQGIVQIYFMPGQVKKKYFDPIIVMQARDVQNFRNTLADNLEGRLGVYPKNGLLYFTTSGIAAKYGTCGMQIMIRDGSAISDSSQYPIDPAMEGEFLARCVQWFMNRKRQPHELLKDNNEQPMKA